MGEVGKQTLTLNLTAREMEALSALAVSKGMSKTAVLRQALRLYQLVDHRLAEGERMFFSGDDQRTREFIGVL